MSSVISSYSHRSTNECVFQLITNQSLQGKQVLDFGAGRGHMAQRLAEKLRDDGLDPSDVLTPCDMDPGHFEYDQLNCIGVQFGTRLPFESQCFDLIYSIEVVEHLRSPYDFLKEAFRVLKPGGRLIISVPNMLNMNARMRYLLMGLTNMFGLLSLDDKDAGHVAGHIMPLGYNQLHYGLRKEGFTDIKFHTDRLKKSSMFLATLMYPFVQAAHWVSVRHAQSREPELVAENSDILENLNSMKMMCSRSCILEATRPAVDASTDAQDTIDDVSLKSDLKHLYGR